MVKRFAGITGFIFLLLGIIGFFTHELLGLIHFDTLHNIIHLVVGVAGLIASGSEEQSVVYSKTIGLVFLLLGVIGLLMPDMFGLMHMESTENILHLVVGAIGLYLGFTAQTIQTVKLKSKST